MTTHPTEKTGTVLSYRSNFYTVRIGNRPYECFLKGLLKKEGTDVVVGDRVIVDSLDETNATGRVASVLPRNSQLLRPKIANVTRALIVAALKQPDFSFEQVDRYLTRVRLAEIMPAMCITKIDLDNGDGTIESIHSVYHALGIPVFTTTIKDAESIYRVFDALRGDTVVLAGQSGVGKSSMINAARPELALETREVSEKIGRGQHTTRYVQLISLDDETYIADTPGFSYLKFDDTDPHDLERAFTEFAPWRDACRFDNCLHLDETDCAVRDHLEEIPASRYDSYRIFQQEAREYVEMRRVTATKQEYGYKTITRSNQEAVKILKLKEKQRQASRRTLKQQISDWDTDEDGTLDP